MPSFSLTVNGKPRRVDALSDETLLVVLRDRLDLIGEVRLRGRAVPFVTRPLARACTEDDHRGLNLSLVKS